MKTNFLLLSFLFCLHLFSQKQGNIWYFGNHAGLDFSNGNPVAITNGATYDGGSPLHSEGTSSICDSAGNLLFYTNGQQVWNRNHQIMPNGDSLLGHWSSTQAAIIVPKPGSSEYFYVFTTDAFYDDDLTYGFRYSVVDICADNGLGDIKPTLKNILLLDTVAEKVTAVKHGNGNDYWIITHKYYSDAFYAYHLSAAGIVDTVVSHIGSIHPDPASFQGTGASIGELKASPDGNKLAIVNANSGPCILEYFDFDKNTGIISNCVSLEWNPIYNFYGISFSPDNSKLYVTSCLNANGIYQFDMHAGNGNPDSVKASRTLITGYWNYFAMQLGPDGKIYVARAGIPRHYVGVINDPNNPGVSCNYVDSAIYLNGQTCSLGLPNFMDSYAYTNTYNSCTDMSGIETQNQNTEILIYPNPNNGMFQISNSNYNISKLEIYNALGENVFSISNPKDQTSIEINLSAQSDGIYFARVETDKRSFTQKIIISK